MKKINSEENLKLLDFIESFEKKHGYQPCLKTMANSMFSNDPQKAKRMLFQLKNAGVITLVKPFRTSKFIVKRIKKHEHSQN